MEEGFTEQFASLGANLVVMGAEADGLLIVQRSAPLATKLTNCARQNPAVYKALKKYLDGSVWAMLGEEVLTIGLAICLNHGINPVASVQRVVGGLFGGKKTDADDKDDNVQRVA